MTARRSASLIVLPAGPIAAGNVQPTGAVWTLAFSSTEGGLFALIADANGNPTWTLIGPTRYATLTKFGVD